MDNIRQVSVVKPFPVEDIQNIQDTASGKWYVKFYKPYKHPK